MLYFSFTTLTTIGLGDAVPKSNFERIFIALALIGGVAVFSYFLGELSEMIFFYNKHFEEFNDTDSLFKFFNILKKYNYGEQLDP